jgi:hypothetical protein
MSRLNVFGWGLVAATVFALLSASLAAGEARAGDCAAMNFTFNLGTTNLCDTTTRLSVSLPGFGFLTGLEVVNASGNAIDGQATSTKGGRLAWSAGRVRARDTLRASWA